MASTLWGAAFWLTLWSASWLVICFALGVASGLTVRVFTLAWSLVR